MPWKTLQPYMDWFADAKHKELHTRVAGRTWEQWRGGQPVHKESKPEKICDARTEMEEYLKNDVMCLDGLVEKMGSHMWIKYGADIQVTCKMWEHCKAHLYAYPLEADSEIADSTTTCSLAAGKPRRALCTVDAL